jgi:uncharacterized protein (TIGR03000 family)
MPGKSQSQGEAIMSHRPIRFIVLAALFVALGPVRGQDTPKQQSVTLKVLLPAPNVKLMIQDKVTQQYGTERVFVSPALEPGKDYIYTLTAKWEPNNYTKITRTKSVKVQAGQTVDIDLRQADPARPDDILVRYVPTPMEVVEAMLKLGSVGKDDVVFDLGCGDGRIVVTAVSKYGAKRGVGVDIDPERIKDSNANARSAKVEDKVDFRMEDVLKIKDYSEASVVMLYMGDELNMALRPILQASLKPGSRIVSHRFLMGDWKPEQTINITDRQGRPYSLHLWKIGEKKE